MKILPRSLVLALPLAALACRTPDANGSTKAEPATFELECICGQPEAAIQGCPHAACASGKRNPENPDCVCSGLTIGE